MPCGPEVAINVSQMLICYKAYGYIFTNSIHKYGYDAGYLTCGFYNDGLAIKSASQIFLYFQVLFFLCVHIWKLFNTLNLCCVETVYPKYKTVVTTSKLLILFSFYFD